MTCTQERFLKDCAEHQMEIVRDDGINRHLKLKKPGTSAYWFEIVTWPGVLAIRGDCGAYLFSRLADMFEFFRTKPERLKAGELYINKPYWMEKIIAVDSNCGQKGSATKFSVDRFKREVVSWFRRKTGEDNYWETRKDRWAIWKAIREDILEETDSHDESHNWSLLRDFSVWMEDDCEYQYKNFFDDWEAQCREYDFHFLWNCYAIAWAIQQYDAAKATSEAAHA